MMGAPARLIVSGHDLIDELSDEKRFDKAVRGSLRRVRARRRRRPCSPPIPTSRNWSKAAQHPDAAVRQPARMTSYHGSMVDIAEQLVKKWERLNGDEEIDVVHDMTCPDARHHRACCGFDLPVSIHSTAATTIRSWNRWCVRSRPS